MVPVRGAPAVVVVLAATAWAGCILPSASAKSGSHLEPDTVAAIVPGQTTPAQLVERFGPPLVIAERGQTVSVPAASGLTPRASGCRAESGSSFAIGSDAWFEAFSGQEPLQKEHRIYYWYSSRTWGLQFVLPFVILHDCGTRTDELLVLVNHATGQVDGWLLYEGP